MASVVAMSKVPGSVAAPGRVLPVASHASADGALASLRDGGALFLVATRPGKRLWLVAILERPKRVADLRVTVLEKGRPLPPDAWVGKPNTTPIIDVTSTIAVPTRPRELTRAEEGALRRLARQGTARPVAAPPEARWRFERVLSAADGKKLTRDQRAQLAVACTHYDGWETRAAALPPSIFSRQVELWHVFDRQRRVFDFWSEFGDSGMLFFAGSVEPVGIEVMQGGWAAYPKAGWVKRGLKLDLPHLAWELSSAFDRVRRRKAVAVPEPSKGQRVRPLTWRTRGKRTGDLEGR